MNRTKKVRRQVTYSERLVGPHPSSAGTDFGLMLLRKRLGLGMNQRVPTRQERRAMMRGKP